MQTRSKSDADAASRLRTRGQHAKKNLRLDDDTHMPVKSTVAPPAPPPAVLARCSCSGSHNSGGEGTPNSTRRAHVTKTSSYHPNPGVDNHQNRATATTPGSPTRSMGDSPRRQSVRRAVLDKQPKPTTIFRHHLFLEPTLARQAKKRRQKEREQRMSVAVKTTGEGPSRTTQRPSHHHQHHHEDSDNDNLPIRLLVNNSKHASGRGPTQNHTETFAYRKRTWGEVGIKKREEDSPLPCAAKVPRRKMSAVAPGPDRTFQVATFRRARDHEELPEGAKELMAQADMARQKKKKPKHWPIRHNSHLPCYSLETGLSPSTNPKSDSWRSTGSDVEGDDGALLLGPSMKRPVHGKRSKRKNGETRHDRSSGTSNNPSVDNLLSQKSLDWTGDAILRRRQYALDFLASAHDISSIYAGIVVINDLYDGDDFPPSIARVVIQAQAMGIILLTESLTTLLAKQMVGDDIHVSSLGARLMVKRLIDHLTIILMDDMSLHPEKMMGSGFSTSEVGIASPILRGVLDEIRQVFLALSEEVLTMGGDHGTS